MAALGSPNQFVGSQVIPIRPLSVGMVTEGSDVLLKAGAMVNLEGFDVVERGLRRVGGFIQQYGEPIPLLFGDDQIDADRRRGEVPIDFFSLTLATGDTRAIVLTNRLLYVFDPSSGYAPVYWKKVFTVSGYDDSGTDAVINIAGDEVTDSMLAAGDWLLLNSSTKLYKIETVVYTAGTDTTNITIKGKPTTAPTTFKVLKAFVGRESDVVGWCLGRNAAWFVDGVSPCVFRYDGTWLCPIRVQESSTDATRTMYGAKYITHFRDRLYFGDVQDGSAGTLKAHQRIRWTEVLGWGLTNDFVESPAINYQDLAGKIGGIVGIIGLEELLFAFTTDAVFYGQQTSLEGLPYAFVELQTGGVSVVGPNAYGGLLGSLIFVGQDDVYTIGLDQGYPVFGKIGTPIANELFPFAHPTKVTVSVDPLNSRVIVGVPTLSPDAIDDLWIWNYRTKGWSKETDIRLRTLTTSAFANQFRFSEIDPTWEFDSSPISGLSFDSLMRVPGFAELHAFDTNNYLLKYEADALGHSVFIGGVKTLVPIAVEIETPDYDFDMPDDDKTFLAFGMRIRDTAERTETIRLSLEASGNHGTTWRSLGTLTFPPGDTEDKLAFRFTAGTVRFRVRSGVLAVEGPSWTVLEITLKVKVRGFEAERGTSRVLV